MIRCPGGPDDGNPQGSPLAECHGREVAQLDSRRDLVMSWRQSIALTLFVGLVTVTGLWVLVLVAVPISSAFSLMAERRRQEAAAKPERDAGQRVDAIREPARRAFPLKYPPTVTLIAL
jgi:hypothetical protein